MTLLRVLVCWVWMDWRVRLVRLLHIQKWRRNSRAALLWRCTGTREWIRLWCCCTFPWHHVLPTNTTLFPFKPHHYLPLSLLFCLKFNKGWKSGGLKRASGVFWHGFMSHAGAMWTWWHWGGGGGCWGQEGSERGTVGGNKRTKEGKFWTRGTGKRRELQKNEVVAEANLCSNRTPVKRAVQTEQHVNEKSDWKAKVRVMARVSKVTSWCSMWKLV